MLLLPRAGFIRQMIFGNRVHPRFEIQNLMTAQISQQLSKISITQSFASSSSLHVFHAHAKHEMRVALKQNPDNGFIICSLWKAKKLKVLINRKYFLSGSKWWKNFSHQINIKLNKVNKTPARAPQFLLWLIQPVSPIRISPHKKMPLPSQK